MFILYFIHDMMKCIYDLSYHIAYIVFRLLTISVKQENVKIFDRPNAVSHLRFTVFAGCLLATIHVYITVTVYPSAPWKLICSMCHSSSFIYRGLDFLWTTQQVFPGKQRSANPTGAPGPCSQLFELELLIYFCTLYVQQCINLVNLCSLLCFVWFPCLVFVPGLHSFDFS